VSAIRRSLLTATGAGFAGVVALHAATGSGPLVAASSTTTTTAPSGGGTTTTTVPGAARSAVGADTQFGYGSIAVKVTVRGTRIVAVSVASLSTLESYSQQLAAQAIPYLTSEALAAQSANIQSISGASYTSQGYDQSLQSALSQLGL
jgi:uncharacterized protein with FMN-binding domain